MLNFDGSISYGDGARCWENAFQAFGSATFFCGRTQTPRMGFATSVLAGLGSTRHGLPPKPKILATPLHGRSLDRQPVHLRHDSRVSTRPPTSCFPVLAATIKVPQTSHWRTVAVCYKAFGGPMNNVQLFPHRYYNTAASPTIGSDESLMPHALRRHNISLVHGVIR